MHLPKMKAIYEPYLRLANDCQNNQPICHLDSVSVGSQIQIISYR